MNKIDYIKKIKELDDNIKFQYWYMNNPSPKWFTYDELIKKYPNLFEVNNQFLRTGINNKYIQELRLDIDTKNSLNEKDLFCSINTALQICNTLNSNKIKYSFYYSGGSGIHIHTLYYTEDIKKSLDQKQVRESLCKYLGIFDLIDKNLLSNNVMLTCEGYQKRNSKTKNNKIYIPNKYLIDTNSIIDYIEENKRKIIINKNYFEEINDFRQKILNFINEDNEPSKHHTQGECKAIREDFIYSDTYNTPKNDIRGVSLCSDEKIIKQHLFIFSSLYKKKKLVSRNKYYLMVGTYICHCVKDYPTALNYFKIFMKVTPNNLPLSIEKKFQIIVDRFNTGHTRIFTELSNKYLTKQEFYKEYNSVWGLNK